MTENKKYFAQCIAEFFGTFMLVFIGESAIAQSMFSSKEARSMLAVNLSFGIAVYTALMIAGPISGAHVNPAVTISLLTVRQIKPVQCIFYIVGQMFGAFFGALFVYLLHLNLFNFYDRGSELMLNSPDLAGIFFTSPAIPVSHWNSFFDQVLGTAILMIFIMALSKKTNKLVSEPAKPFAFVLIIVAITSAFATNCGAAINPARDLGPRLFAAFVYGWGSVFSRNYYFFWIPIIGPIVGAIIGVWIFEGYYYLVKDYANNSEESKNDSVELRRQGAPAGEEVEKMI